jgi:hypothetical protein
MIIDCSADELFLTKETLWRECESGGITGMRSVCHAIANRAIKYKVSIFQAITKKYAFSSINAPGLPNELVDAIPIQTMAEVVRLKKKVNELNTMCVGLSRFPQTAQDLNLWNQAETIAVQVYGGTDQDITGGATLYYAVAARKGAKPDWDFSKLRFTGNIAGQNFYVEMT